jgi:hypothetical protein
MAHFTWRPAYHKMQPVISLLCFIHSVLHIDLQGVAEWIKERLDNETAMLTGPTHGVY